MTTNNFRDHAGERDNDFVQALCHTMQRDMLRDSREWIEAELKALITEAQVQQACTSGAIGAELASVIERLGVISRIDLREAVKDCSDKIHDVQEGFREDVYDAYDQMQQEITKMVRIIRALLEIRAFIEPMTDD